MKVLHFYKTYFPDSFGGVEQVIFQLASGSAGLGIDSTVLSLTPNRVDRVIELNGHQVFRCRSNFKIASTDFSLSSFWQFNELAKKADIVHYHFPWPFMDLVHFVVNHNKPSVVTYHSDIVKQKTLLKLYRPLKTKFLNSMDAIVATSPNYRVTSDVLQLHQNKVKVIPIGLDKNLYPTINIERAQYWRENLGEKFFLFIGVLRYYKGLNILLDALALGDLPTVIIGAGPIEYELKVKAESLGLKNITFLGQVSEEDKVAILGLSYAVVFPSHLRSEAFGISLLEGAMFGKPMISSEIGTGTSFINSDQQTGIVVLPSSPKDLHVAMTYLWNNPEVAALMGLKAFDRYEKLFTADKMCQAYAALYQRLIDKKSK
jgi:glycosyltransferase involved in cell wall biosynthesis